MTGISGRIKTLLRPCFFGLSLNFLYSSITNFEGIVKPFFEIEYEIEEIFGTFGDNYQEYKVISFPKIIIEGK